jgi:hypothetical protein
VGPHHMLFITRHGAPHRVHGVFDETMVWIRLRPSLKPSCQHPVSMMDIVQARRLFCPCTAVKVPNCNV